MLVTSFFIMSIFILTSAGCGNKETPDKQQVPEEQQTVVNNNPAILIDTTAIQKGSILPSSASDSLLKQFRFYAKGENDELLKEYPAGYGIVMLNDHSYSSIINIKDSRVYLNLEGVKFNKKNDNEVGIFIRDISVETISMKDLYHFFTLDYKPKQIHFITEHFKTSAQLLMKTKAGMIVLVGFKER
jgi:hypothetical protein